MVSVKVKYKYGSKGQKPTVGTQEVIQAEGKTESAVMAVLRKRYPNREIIITEIS